MATNLTSLPATLGQRFSSDITAQSLIDAKSRSQRELNYKAFVVANEYVNTNGSKGILVDAWLPETVGMDVNATYDAPFAQGLSSLVDGNLSALARFLGTTLTTQAFTAQIWQGGGHVEFQLPFIFTAETSPSSDVMRPIKNLLKLTMPKDPKGGGLLESPGPVVDLAKLAANSGKAVSSALSSLTQGASISGMIDSAKQVVSDPIGSIYKAKDKADSVAQPIAQGLVNSIKNNISLYIGRFLYLPSVVITDVSPTFDVMPGPDGNPVRATVNVTFRTFFIPTQNDLETMFPASRDS